MNITKPRLAATARRIWRWVSLAAVLAAFLAVVVVFFIAGPLLFFGALVALTPLCIALSMVDNRITEGSWLLPR